MRPRVTVSNKTQEPTISDGLLREQSRFRAWALRLGGLVLTVIAFPVREMDTIDAAVIARLAGGTPAHRLRGGDRGAIPTETDAFHRLRPYERRDGG